MPEYMQFSEIYLFLYAIYVSHIILCVYFIPHPTPRFPSLLNPRISSRPLLITTALSMLKSDFHDDDDDDDDDVVFLGSPPGGGVNSEDPSVPKPVEAQQRYRTLECRNFWRAGTYEVPSGPLHRARRGSSSFLSCRTIQLFPCSSL